MDQAPLINDIVKQVRSLLSFRDADPLCLRDPLFILQEKIHERFIVYLEKWKA